MLSSLLSLAGIVCRHKTFCFVLFGSDGRWIHISYVPNDLRWSSVSEYSKGVCRTTHPLVLVLGCSLAHCDALDLYACLLGECLHSYG